LTARLLSEKHFWTGADHGRHSDAGAGERSVGPICGRVSNGAGVLVNTGRLLEQFVDFAEAAGAETITTQLALQWATLPPGGSPIWHAQRLGVVRCLVSLGGTVSITDTVPLVPGHCFVPVMTVVRPASHLLG
jgi:hypothetical protein